MAMVAVVEDTAIKVIAGPSLGTGAQVMVRGVSVGDAALDTVVGIIRLGSLPETRIGCHNTVLDDATMQQNFWL